MFKTEAKHPIKIHICGSISTKEATSFVMITRIMNLKCFVAVYEADRIPFIQERFPDGHRLYEDNDLKHLYKYIEEFEAMRCELVIHTT